MLTTQPQASPKSSTQFGKTSPFFAHTFNQLNCTTRLGGPKGTLPPGRTGPRAASSSGFRGSPGSAQDSGRSLPINMVAGGFGEASDFAVAAISEGSCRLRGAGGRLRRGSRGIGGGNVAIGVHRSEKLLRFPQISSDLVRCGQSRRELLPHGLEDKGQREAVVPWSRVMSESASAPSGLRLRRGQGGTSRPGRPVSPDRDYFQSWKNFTAVGAGELLSGMGFVLRSANQGLTMV